MATSASPQPVLPGVVSRPIKGVAGAALPPVREAKAEQTKDSPSARPATVMGTLATLAVSPTPRSGKERASPKFFSTEFDKRDTGPCSSSRGLSSCATTARGPSAQCASTIGSEDWMRSPTPFGESPYTPRRPHTSCDLHVGREQKPSLTRPVSVLLEQKTKQVLEDYDGSSSKAAEDSFSVSEADDPLQLYEKDWKWTALDAYLESLTVEDLPQGGFGLSKPAIQLSAEGQPQNAAELDLHEAALRSPSSTGAATPTPRSAVRVTPSRTRGDPLCEFSVGTLLTPISPLTTEQKATLKAPELVPVAPQRPSSRAVGASPRQAGAVGASPTFWNAGNDARLRLTVDGKVGGKVRRHGTGKSPARSWRSP